MSSAVPPGTDERVVSQVSQTSTTSSLGAASYSGIGNPPSTSVQNTKTQTTKSMVNNSPMGKRVGMDVMTRLTQRANQALMQGVVKVKELGVQLVDTEHVLWGLLSDSAIYHLLTEFKSNPLDIQKELEKNFKKGTVVYKPGTPPPQFGPRVKRVLELSLSSARSLGYEFISPEHILLALSHEGEGLACQILAKFNITTAVLDQKVTGKKEDKKDEEKVKSILKKFGLNVLIMRLSKKRA